MARSTDGAPMTDGGSSARTHPRGLNAERRHKVRLTTWVVSLIAVAFYIGFIILTVMRAHR